MISVSENVPSHSSVSTTVNIYSSSYTMTITQTVPRSTETTDINSEYFYTTESTATTDMFTVASSDVAITDQGRKCSAIM